MVCIRLKIESTSVRRPYGGRRISRNVLEPAPTRRYELGQESIDGDHLQPHTNAGDETPRVHTGGRVLERHDGGADGIPDQRRDKNRASSKSIGDESESHAPDEHPGKGAEHE